nr:hypothetical protein [Desulfobacula sp.]
MGNGPRDYTDKTLKRLFGLSGNLCAFPGCSKRLVNQNNAKDSNICHIEAANPSGERYNMNMSDVQRADYDNLILLCVQHHDETNDTKKYTVEHLKLMKKNHESYYLNERIKKNPSMLKNTIAALSRIDLTKYPETPGLRIIDPNEKIEFNQLKKTASLIREYRVYHTKLNALYSELENQGSIVKENLLRAIKLIYDTVKSEFVLGSEDPLRAVQENSDAIFDNVYSSLYKKLEDSEFWEEDIVLGLHIVMIDAFIRCKILEEPAS